MTYQDLYEKAVFDLEQNKITVGEYEKRIKPLKAEIRQWIPVSERLPEELKYVLVCTKRGYVTCGYCVNDFNYGCVGKDFFLNLDDVVAWMPMPKPYNGGEQE